MAPRRGVPTNSLSPPDVTFPGSGGTSPGTTSSPRAVSPSGGFTQFLARPTKWFGRSTSANGGRSSISSNEPRSSTSSIGRKHKISHPTDPRPILDSLSLSPEKRVTAASRSVLDLSLAHNTIAADDNWRAVNSRTPSSPSQPALSRGLGDLRNISRKPWSKSADDLGKLSTQISSPILTPLDTTFHDKIEQYRNNRSGSTGSMSNAPSPSASSVISAQKNYPFPVISPSLSEPLSSSPPQLPSSHLCGPSPVNTSGAALTPVLSNSSAHSHSRSQSFTPRLPSKLSSPKLALQPPPSPKRKGSTSSEYQPEREKILMGAAGGYVPSPRSAFPFTRAGTGNKAVPQIVPTPASEALPFPAAHLAPPKISEPPSDAKLEKRTSQVVYHSGFVNRLVDFSPSTMSIRANYSYMNGDGASTLSKGWKPFKLVLKGSKLYFYKPPSDRSTAVKELFPTELVAVLEDEGLADRDAEPNEGEDQEVGRGGRGRDREDMRRRRAYWGRNTHPSLVVVGERVGHGTFEALVHEAVFATTFLKPTLPSSDHDDQPVASVTSPQGEVQPTDDEVHIISDRRADVVQETEAPRYKASWLDFATTILFSMPVLVGRAKFEVEFTRCCAYLMSGAEEAAKAEESTRVRWLASQYLNYHGTPANCDAWETWRKETIPAFPAEYNSVSRLGGVPQTSSMQALYTASPQLNSSFAEGTEFSPNLGAFSPRPNDGNKMVSIVEALGKLPSVAQSSMPSLASAGSTFRSLRESLGREGLTREALVGLNAQLLARSLSDFHQGLLKQIPDNFTVDLCFRSEMSEAKDSASTPVGPSQSPLSSSSSLAPFVGSEEQPHWLTRTILTQILVPETGGPSPSILGSSDDRQGPSSRAHTRSEVISSWVKVGELCRRTGDECSWRSIFAAVCSRPIARLDKVWKRVDADAISLVQSWVEPNENTSPYLAGCPVIIPWAGDVKNQIRLALDRARDGEEDQWQLVYLMEAREKFEALRTTFALCTRRSIPDQVNESEDVEALIKHWQGLREGRNISTLASKFVRIDQFMSLSLAAEPRRKGLFEPYYWTRPATQPLSQTLTAVLFPEPLPTVSFINRELLSRGRLESSASLNVQDLQQVREVWLKPGDDGTIRTQATKPNGIDLGGTMLPIYDGELLLLVQPLAESGSLSRPTSRTPSRPPSSVVDSQSSDKTFSRSPSIRVTPGSPHGLDRKPSMIRRNSLPSISQRTSLVGAEVSSDKPLRVVVQAGTLDRLVDVLVHGLQGVSVSVADDNGEMPLSDTQTREVKVDMDEFTDVWWSVYRSYVTSQVLFEFLRKRYNNARLSHSPSMREINDVVRKRSAVLETMNEWINRGGGAQDVLDDMHLYSSFESFLTQTTEHDLTQHIQEDDAHAHLTLTLLEQIRKTLHLTFLSQTLRPARTILPPEASADGLGVKSYGSETPDIDQLHAEELVSNLDSMASAAFRNITQEDLFVTADLLEVQSADRTGWFLPREPSSISDEVEIQFMSSYIMEIEPSSMISELAQGSLYRLLPPSVRSCIRAFGILRKWLLSKLVAPRLGLRARQARMELMLQAAEVCRIRNAESSSTIPLAERPCVRSFVEALVTSAILSVESRMHYRAWQNVALARGTTCDTLSALISKPAIPTTASREALTVDIGWILERMLEVISTPDVLESINADSLSLVNFDKRRSLHTLITSASGLANARRARQRRHFDRSDFERLNNVERDVSAVQFDLRSIREEAYREATQAGPLGAKKTHRPFQALVSLQQEKNKRDRHLRDRLSREKRQEQQKNDRREEYFNKAMNTRRPPLVLQKQHRNKKSMSSAFFQFMRPISSAFSSESLSSAVKRTPADLDFTPSHKPSLVLSVVDARVAQFVNNERSFTFQLDTEDGGHYLLQATGKPDMKKWMDTIQHVSKTAAKRRLTYLGQNSKMQLADHLLSQPATSTRDPRAVFGVELNLLLQREAENGEVQPGAIPSVLERLIAEVESRGLMECGIYRIAGAHSEVNAYRDALNRGEWPISSSTDIHAVCDLIKSWFRVLPGGIFPTSSYNEILEAVGVEGVDLTTRLSNIRRVVHALPDPNFDLLKRIVEHLEKVTDYEENNQMTAESLATVFSPNLLRSPNNDISLFFANMSAGHRVTKLLIAHFHTIFDNDDPEAEFERDQEEFEFDEPIPEEDEDENLLRDDDANILDDQDMKVLSEPPVLEVNLGSPTPSHYRSPRDLVPGNAVHTVHSLYAVVDGLTFLLDAPLFPVWRQFSA